MTKERAIYILELECERYERLIEFQMEKDNFTIANSYGENLEACRMAVAALKGESA